MEIYNEDINDLFAVENQKLQIHESLEVSHVTLTLLQVLWCIHIEKLTKLSAKMVFTSSHKLTKVALVINLCNTFLGSGFCKYINII